MSQTTSHPTAAALAAYALGKLTAEKTDVLAKHVELLTPLTRPRARERRPQRLIELADGPTPRRSGWATGLVTLALTGMGAVVLVSRVQLSNRDDELAAAYKELPESFTRVCVQLSDREAELAKANKQLERSYYESRNRVLELLERGVRKAPFDWALHNQLRHYYDAFDERT